MDKLKPGRELDALVAEKVMECAVERDQFTRGAFSEKRPDDSIDFFLGKTNDRVPNYSTDIAAAWEVVDKMRDDNFQICEHGTHWKAYFGSPWAGAETAPHAICLAALRAVGS